MKTYFEVDARDVEPGAIVWLDSSWHTLLDKAMWTDATQLVYMCDGAERSVDFKPGETVTVKY